MGVIKFLRDFSDLFNWNTQENPTSEQTYQNAVKNWTETEMNLVDAVLWQPETAYTVGNQVRTPSLPSEVVLVCTTAGTSGATEQTYTGVSVGDSVTDGTVTWLVANSLPNILRSASGKLFKIVLSSVDGNANTNVDVGWDWTNRDGALLALRSSITGRGDFQLSARDATNSTALQGYPSGSLQWDGKDIERVHASGSGYIRYVSGLQICWGQTNTINSSTTVTINFAAAFKATQDYNVAIGRWWAASASEEYYLSDSSTTSIKLTTLSAGGGNHAYMYIAVGLWK